jgi:hypothetical protein
LNPSTRIAEPNIVNNFWPVSARLRVDYSVHPIRGHEGPVGVYRYSSTLSLTSAIDGWVVNVTPRPLYPEEGNGAYCVGVWVNPRAGLVRCGKSRPHGPSSP